MATRKNVSTRAYLAADGSKSVGPNAGGKVQYILLADDGKTPHSTFEFDLNSPGGHMFAQFGFVTKIGNVANSVLNGAEPGTIEDAAGEIQDFLNGIADGNWREPGESRARGPKYDKAVLAYVLFEGRSADKRTGDWADADTIQARLDNDKSFYAKVRNNQAAMAAYHAEMAKRGTAAQSKTVDDLD